MHAVVLLLCAVGVAADVGQRKVKPPDELFCSHTGAKLYEGDFDGDKVTDLLCMDDNGNVWMILSSNPVGHSGRSTWCLGEEVAIEDRNSDGKDDLRCPSTGAVLYSSSKGVDLDLPNIVFCGHPGAKLYKGDFDGDKAIDLLCTDDMYNFWTVLSTSENQFGRSTFCEGGEIIVKDQNNDGKDDLRCPSTGGVVYSTASGVGFNSLRSQRFCGHQGAKMYHGDFDGDGTIDLLCRDGDGYMWTALSNSTVEVQFGRPSWCRGEVLAVEDRNNDGRDDLRCPSSGSVVYSTERGVGVDLPDAYVCGPGAKLYKGDFDGDGTIDLLCRGSSSFWEELSTNPAGRSGTSTWCTGEGIEVEDRNGDGKDDLRCPSTGTVLYSSGAGVGLGRGDSVLVSLEVHGGYVYALHERGLKVYEEVVGGVSLVGTVEEESVALRRMVVAGGRVYAAGSKLMVFDVSDPRQPQKVGEYTLDTINLAVDTYDGNTVYALQNGGTSVSVVPSGTPFGKLDSGGNGPSRQQAVVARGGKVYVGGHNAVYVLQRSNPTATTVDLVGKYEDTALGEVTAVVLNGVLLYVGGFNGVFALDVSFSSTPKLLGAFVTTDKQHPVTSLQLLGKHLYAARLEREVVVLNVSDPTKLVEMESHPMSTLRAMAVSVQAVYVGLSTNVIAILAVMVSPETPTLTITPTILQNIPQNSTTTLPLTPRPLPSPATPSPTLHWGGSTATFTLTLSDTPTPTQHQQEVSVHRMQWLGNHLFVWRNAELEVLYTSEQSIVPVGRVPLSNQSGGMDVTWEKVYATGGDSTFVVDTTSRHHPRAEWKYSTPGGEGIAYHEGMIYVVARDGKLYVIPEGTLEGSFLRPSGQVAQGVPHCIAAGRQGVFVGAGEVVLAVRFNARTATLIEEGRIALGDTLHSMVLSNNVLYVGGSSKVYAVDVSDPTKPRKLSEYETGSKVVEMNAWGEWLYVSAGGCLQMLNVSLPSIVHFREITCSHITAFSVSRFAAYVWTESGVEVLDPPPPQEARPITPSPEVDQTLHRRAEGKQQTNLIAVVTLCIAGFPPLIITAIACVWLMRRKRPRILDGQYDAGSSFTPRSTTNLVRRDSSDQQGVASSTDTDTEHSPHSDIELGDVRVAPQQCDSDSANSPSSLFSKRNSSGCHDSTHPHAVPAAT